MMSDKTIAMRGFSDSLPMALLQAREATMRLFRPLLAAHDLTEQQWRVLRALASTGEAMEVAQIVDATFLLAPSLSRILKDLEARSLVSRAPVASDQRRAEISLTSDGHELVATIAPESESIYNLIEASFGATQLQALIQQLGTLRDRAEQIGSSDD